MMLKNSTSTKRSNPANPFRRMVNFVVDTMIWLALYLLVAALLDQYVFHFSSYLINYIYSISLGLILYLGYYFILEYYFGRTVGKFISRTKVITHKKPNKRIHPILTRTLLRLVPIDIFSFLFTRNGFHDQFSKTSVIRNIG